MIMPDGETLKFFSYVVKPWDELNELLAKPYIYEPAINDIIGKAHNLAITIKHLCDSEEDAKSSRREVDKLSPENKILSDVADMAKHKHDLDIKSRENELRVTTTIEFDGSRHKFSRTMINIIYKNGREFDFAFVAVGAIKFWAERKEIKMPHELKVSFSKEDFKEKASLYYVSSLSLAMQSTQLKWLRRNADGQLEPYEGEIAVEFFNVV